MTGRLLRVSMASVAALALTLTATETWARASAAPRGPVTAPHATVRAPGGPTFRHARRGGIGPYWPAGGAYYNPGDADAIAGPVPPASADINYTYKYDVPWDWAHRYPPNVVPSDRPYVSSCSSEPVVVPGRDGRAQTVNVTRCY